MKLTIEIDLEKVAQLQKRVQSPTIPEAILDGIHNAVHVYLEQAESVRHPDAGYIAAHSTSVGVFTVI